ncbi:polysaccharide deacetylase family protein [Lysinibacillus sp. NPDC048646]|uniref:polysaccharide deacetylase family protein n=1 Tax=Lysinibacillus sp. NPDC048646 TaxID=3390574 RepID=UPI003D01347C
MNLLFTKNNGFPSHPDDMSGRSREIVERYELPKLTFHGLRHTYASFMVSKNVNFKIIQEQLGHVNIQVESSIVKVTFDSIFAGETTKKPSVIFTFDDAWTSQYEIAFAMMLERGFKGNIGVISNWIGIEDEIMSESQIEEMHRHGWDMFNHSANHKNLTNVTVETAVSEVLTCKNWLNERGYNRASTILAYPYGVHNKEIVEALQPHLRYARTLVEGLEPTFPLEALIGKIKNVLTLPAATLMSYVDQAITTQSTLVFCLHKIGTEQDEWETTYNRNDFSTLLDYIYEKKDLIDVKTISEWVSGNKS